MENCIETEILGGAPESPKPADEAASQTTDEPVGEEAPNENSDETGGETGVEVADAPETNPTPTDGATSPEEVERLVAEAEARGYERGRNAGIEAWINESRSALPHSREKPDCESEIMILNNMRRSVWDE